MICLSLVTGCATPFLVFPGKRLSAPVSEVCSFSFAQQFNLMKLEVRPDKPYSVILRVVVIDQDLYVDAADRRWHTYLAANPNVRVQLGDSVYPAVAVEMRDAQLLERFIQGRRIYRLDPVRSVDCSRAPGPSADAGTSTTMSA
jgi:hypothetical protein